MKWKGDLDVASVDTAFLRDAFAAFLVSARNLGVDNEHIVDPETGQPLDHLRVHSGVHPQPGVVYESIRTASSPRAAALTDVTSRALISLEADNEQLLRVSGVDEEAAWHLTVQHRRFHLTLDVAASRVGKRIVFAPRGEGSGSGKLTAEIDAFDTPEAMAHEMLRSMLQAGVEPADRA